MFRLGVVMTAKRVPAVQSSVHLPASLLILTWSLLTPVYFLSSSLSAHGVPVQAASLPVALLGVSALVSLLISLRTVFVPAQFLVSSLVVLALSLASVLFWPVVWFFCTASLLPLV